MRLRLRMRLRRLIAVARIVRVLTLAGAAACLAAPTVLAQTSPQASQLRVRLAEIYRREAFLPLYGALRQEMFQRQGLAVETAVMLGPDRILAALLNGEADVALGGPDTAIFSALSARAESIKIVGAVSRFDSAFLVSRQNIAPDRFSWDSLKGKKVMGWFAGSFPAVYFDRAMRRNRLDPQRDVDYDQKVAYPVRISAWRDGRFDFAAFDLADAAALERERAGYPLVSIGAAAGPTVYTVFLSTADYIRSHPEIMQKWANATQAALAWTEVASLDEAVAAAASFLPQLNRADLASAIGRYREIRMWQSDATVSPQAIEDVQTMMIESGIVPPDKRVPYDTVVEPRFAEAAKRAAPR